MERVIRLNQRIGIAAAAVLLALSAGAAEQAVLPMKVESEINAVSVELTSVQKTGDTLTVKWKYISTGDKDTGKLFNQMGGQIEDKVYYIDTKNKKKYLVVRDSENHPVISAVHDLRLAPGETKNCWAKFPAPPADVTAIAVYIPGAPPFENVAVAE